MVITAAAIVFSSLYVLLVMYLSLGWNRLRLFILADKGVRTKVTVIVPVRNEELTIEACLSSIAKQQYPAGSMELIVADDGSDDKTPDIINQFIGLHPGINVKCIRSGPGEEGGKKHMIEQAVVLASGSLIVTTDGDCRMGPQWITAIVQYYEQFQPRMICGPVCLDDSTGWFQKMQSLEFISLIGTGAASIAQGAPLMCNGANLAFTREAFLQCSGYSGNKHLPSGDDVFLMISIQTLYPGSVHFMKNREAMVSTRPETTLKGFIRQRVRWAGKTSFLSILHRISLTAVTVFILNLLIIVLVVASILDSEQLNLLSSTLFVKVMADLLFLTPILTFFKKQKLLLLFLPLQLLYPLYTVVAGLLALFGEYTWKGRIYRKRFLK